MEKSIVLKQFLEICKTTEEQALFFLEASGYNLDEAVEEYFSDTHLKSTKTGTTSNSYQFTSNSDSCTSFNNPVKSTTHSRFATIASLHNHESSEDSDLEEGQAFYVGGSLKGAGQQVLGPPRKKTQDIVKEVFKGARDHGAEELSISDHDSAVHSSRSLAFTGAGRRLGESLNDDIVVEGLKSKIPAKRVDMVLKMWSNGFSINDGHLRDFANVANQSFLEDIKRGKVPDELLRESNGGELNLNLEDHHLEDYIPVKRHIQAFHGTGHVLGSPSLPMATVLNQALRNTTYAPEIDNSMPTTQVQLRLADGSRIVLALNESHTVGDLRAAIIGKSPQYTDSNFVLMTTFPSKELTDMTLTLAQAGLLNASIVQRLK